MAITFEVYRNGKRQAHYTPVAASAVGPESVPIPGEVSFTDGLLRVNRTEQAAGVALLWDCGEIGEYHLETTRLKPREKPYVLNVELARHRLMRLIQKQEDWNLFDFPRADKLNQGFRDAQSLLAQALAKLNVPAEASVLGDQALAAAIDVSEQMALFHAELLLNRRRTNNALPKHIFGCRVDWSVQNQRYRETACESLDYIVLPMTWKTIQPEEDVFVTDGVDYWVDAITRARVPIVAGPLVDFSEDSVPDWLFIWEHDFETLRDLAYEYVTKVVQRYRKYVSAWNVVSGIHCGNAFGLSFEQMIELTRLLAAQVKQLLPQSRVLVSIKQPYGEYHAGPNPGVPPMLYAEMVAQSAVNFDAFGVEVVQGVPAPGQYTRDLFQISGMLDKFSTLGKPVFLTNVAAPGRASPDVSDLSQGKLDPASAGRWRAPWAQGVQEQWLDAVYRIALSKPYVESVAWDCLSDLAPSMPGAGLLDDTLKPKPAYAKLQELRELYHKHSRK